MTSMTSELGPVPHDNDSFIMAGGCSGFELTFNNLVNQNSFGSVTSALQV